MVSLSSQVSGYIESITQTKGLDGKARDLQSGDPVALNRVLAKVDDKIYRARVAEAGSVVDAAKAAVVASQRDYQRKSELMKQEIVNQAQMDASRDQYDADKAQLAQAEHSLHEAGVQLSYCELRSPLNGVLLSCDIEVGALVSPGVQTFRIADMSSMKAVFGVPAHVVVNLREGQVLTATTTTYPGVAFAGRITRLGLSADPQSRLFDVEVTLPNPDGRLKVGFVMSLRVPAIGASAPGVLIPLGAIVRPPGDPEGHAAFVVVEEGGAMTARLRSVTLGDVVGDSILVADGLQPEDRVIVRGATVVADGTLVDLIR